MTALAEALAARLAAVMSPVDMPPRAVAHTSELERIAALPRRTWAENDPRIAVLTFEITTWLRHAGATDTLRPIQAVALAELFYYRGLFGAIRVGGGKTLISLLAAIILGARRPVLLIPAKLRTKTHRELARLGRTWRMPITLRIVTYEELSRDYGDETRIGPDGRPLGIFDLADPDLVVADEVHRVKNPRAACTRKLDRFMRTRPMLPFVALSGTITKDRIQDFAHILGWTHKNAAPIPRIYHALQDWAGALNVKVRDDERLGVGALLEFATEEERRTLDPLTAARRGFRRRLIETPGVVAFSREYDGASLSVEESPPPAYGPQTEAAFRVLRLEGKMPDGTFTTGGLEDWQHARELALGFYRMEDPPPPTPWKIARSEWHAAARACISGNHRGIDSLWQVSNACTQHRYPGETWDEARRAYTAWKAIEDSFKPKVVPVWIDDAAIRAVARWMQDHPAGIVWVEHVDFAQRLAQVTGAPYFRLDGLDANKRYIEDARPAIDGAIIASIESNREGRNLQDHYFDNLFVSLPKGGDACEQTVGRTHREGQRSDEVSVYCMITCLEQANAWFKILDESKYIVDLSGLPAKILYCDKDMPDEAEIFARAATTARFGARSAPRPLT